MLVLLSSLLGFFSSSIPSIINLIQDRQDKAHELAIMQLQISSQKELGVQQLEQIQIQADSAQMIALYNNNKPTNTWIDALNESVRPVIAYFFFASYVLTRVFLYKYLAASGSSFDLLITTLWDDQDMSILAGILTISNLHGSA